MRPKDHDEPEGKPKLRYLPIAWWVMMREEWNQRTTFGKIFYPYWLLYGAFCWCIFLLIVTIANGMKAFGKAEKSFTETMPDIYK